MWWRRSGRAVEQTSDLERAFDPLGEHPCPCRRRGRLKLIALMDVLGCDRCPQMFSLQPTKTGPVIGSALTNDEDRRRWRWDGRRWIPTKSLSQRYWPVLLCVGSLLCTIGIPLFLRNPWGLTAGSWLVIALAIAAVPVAVLWIADRP